MYQWIIDCENGGIALTHMAGANSVHRRSEDADTPEVLRGSSKSSLEKYVRDLQDAGRIDKFQLTPTGGRGWLGAVNGPMSRGEYEATTARYNV